MQKYSIVRKIGQGASGKVYLIKDTKNDKLRVAKFIKKSNFIDQSVYDNEISILKHIANNNCFSNIVCLEGYFVHKEYIVIVTNNVVGMSLTQYIDQHKVISSDDLIAIIYQLVYTLYYIHVKLKIAHLDLNPDNIMINPKSLKITFIDFGFSCFTKSCKASGTYGYFSPEMIESLQNRDNVLSFQDSMASDIFSLGIICNELVYCGNPFKNARSMFDVISNINSLSEQKCYRLHSKTQRVLLFDIIKKMLRIDPLKRPTSSDLFKFFDNGKQMYKKVKEIHISKPNEIRTFVLEPSSVKNLTNLIDMNFKVLNIVTSPLKTSPIKRSPNKNSPNKKKVLFSPK